MKHVLVGPILSSGCANTRDPIFPSHNALDCGMQSYMRGSLSLKICKPFFVVIIRVSINFLLGKAMRQRTLCPIGSLDPTLRFRILPKVKLVMERDRDTSKFCMFSYVLCYSSVALLLLYHRKNSTVQTGDFRECFEVLRDISSGLQD